MERKCTNISSLFFCIGFVVILLGLVIYTSTQSDLNRLTKGYDDCGNVCGKQNKDYGISGCRGEDMSSKPITGVETRVYQYNKTISSFKCIKECEKPSILIFNRCFKSESAEKNEEELQGVFQRLSETLIKTWPKMLLTCFIAFVFSYIVLILFRYAIEYIIWIIYIGFIVLIGGLAIVCWVWWATTKVPEEKGSALIAAIVLSVLTVIAVLVLIWFRKRIQLVAQLFKEASKALIDVPSVLFEPVLTFLSLMISIVLFIFFIVLIQTAGNAENTKNIDGSTHVTFEKNGAMGAANVLNFIAFIWFSQFIFGCQHFIIGGTISKWYFARNKSKLFSPLLTTFDHLIRYHLGSVCLGSMIITLIKIIRMLIDSLQKQARESQNVAMQAIACCLACIFEMIEEALKYLVRNAYIIVAKDGTPLFESGRKAFNLIFRNLMDVVALNQFGDLVLFVARLFIMAISMFIGYELMKPDAQEYIWLPVILTGIFAFLIAHCFVSVFEMTVDTIFICFCDDCEENDGNTRPYFMSPELMDVMKKLKEESGGSFNFGEGHPQQPIMPYDPSNPAPNEPKQPGYYPNLPPQDPYYQPGPPQGQPAFYPPQQPDPYAPGAIPYPPQGPGAPYPPQGPGAPYPPQGPQQPYPPQQPGYYPPQPQYNNQY